MTGSTTWTDIASLDKVLLRYPKETVFVTGDTPGIDALVVQFGSENGYRVDTMRKTIHDEERHPGEAWKGLNERMIFSGVQLVLVFHPDLDKPNSARGSQHAINLAAAAFIPVERYLS